MLDRTTTLQRYQTFIDGRWTDAVSGKTFQTFDPYTGAPWALIPECDKADVDRAVDAAYRAFEGGAWPKMTPTARAKIMRRIAELIEQHAEHLGEVEVRDNGKLISEMVAQTKYMPQWFYYYAGLADKIQGAVVSVDRPDHFNYILREPVGVCAFITPWNSPLMLATWKMAPALAAGCTVVIKPSEYTSASLLEFMKLVIAESGNFPAIAQFYADTVLRRAFALVEGILARGMERGEFRRMDVHTILPLFAAPFLLLAMWKHSLGRHTDLTFSPRAVADAHIDVLLRGLAPDQPS